MKELSRRPKLIRKSTEVVPRRLKPQVIAINEELLKQIDIQKANGEIEPQNVREDDGRNKVQDYCRRSGADCGTKEVPRIKLPACFCQPLLRGIETIAESLGKVIAGTEKWGDLLKDVGRAFGQFAADVLKGIAEILLKEALLSVIKSNIRSQLHGGGIVGSTGMSRSNISPLVFLGAPRMHNGGLARR